MIDGERRRVDQPALTDLIIHYLKSKYGAEFNRVAVMGAYCLAQEMELFIVPREGAVFYERGCQEKTSP
jgi:hypothetical protein